MEGLRAQQPTFRQGNTLIQQLMTAGEFPLAVTYAHTVEYTRSRGAPIDWVAVDPMKKYLLKELNDPGSKSTG